MKKFAAVMLSVLSLPSYAQGLLGALQNYQKELQPTVKTTDGTTPVKTDPIVKTKTSGMCKEEVQTSLPLAYITSLILEKDGKLELHHDSRSGKLSLSSPDMITNCSSMINWAADSKVVDGAKTYSIEARLKEGENCADGECEYSVAKVEKGQFKGFEKMKFKQSMAGFESCLEKTGIIKDGKVDSGAIYPGTINEKFDGYKEGGNLVFLSHGPSSNLVKAKYDKFIDVDGCNYTEKIVPEGFVVKSLQQEEDERINVEKKNVEGCGDYHKISEFIEKYQGYSNDLNGIRDQLILDAVKKSAKAVTDGKYSDEDLKTISDFEKYIVKPRIDLANNLYTQAQDLEGDEKKAKLEEMKKVLDGVTPFNQPPFISSAIVQRLEADGRFDDAQKVNGTKALIVSHAHLGRTEDGIVITPEVAQMKLDNFNTSYASELEGKKENYAVKTGQITGMSQTYTQLASQMRQNIQVRTANYSQEINKEYARTQPGGHCYRPYRNAQRCIQDSYQRIQELQAEAQHYNKVDAERAVEYDQKAKDYATMEKEGRDYVARQNGEPVPAPETQVSTTSPAPRSDEGGYTFQYNGYQQQQPQQSYNPYQQQQGFQGQYYFGANSGSQYASYNQNYNPLQQQGYNFNFQGQGQQQYNPYQQPTFGGGNPYQQQGYGGGYQQQGGYWGSPYQAYGNFNLYGGYR